MCWVLRGQGIQVSRMSRSIELFYKVNQWMTQTYSGKPWPISKHRILGRRWINLLRHISFVYTWRHITCNEDQLYPIFIAALMRGTELHLSRWRHQMETFSALLAICAGNSPVPGEFPAQRPVTRSFDVFFDLRPIKRLSKQWWGWWLWDANVVIMTTT